jgi:hypothetical protein
MRRILGALVVAAVVVVLTACGGTEWNTSQAATANQRADSPTSTEPATSAKVAHPGVSTAAAERPYIAAILASRNLLQGQSATDAALVRCAVTAIVHGYGVDAFEARGLSPTPLRKPTASLDALPYPSDAQVTTIGTAPQRCGVGNAVATELAVVLKTDDAATLTCLTEHFDTDPDARGFIVMVLMQRNSDLTAARGAVAVLAACVDLPSLVLREANVQRLDNNTRACISKSLSMSQASLEDFFASDIAGIDSASNRAYLDSLLAEVKRCRSADAGAGFSSSG